MNHEALLPAIQALIRSPQIAHYLVGITANVHSRKKAYVREQIPLFYVLATEVTHEQAIDIERALFAELTQNKRSIAYKKYHAEKRDCPYRASVGGIKDQERAYAIYVAAWA